METVDLEATCVLSRRPMYRVHQERLTIETRGRGFSDVTSQVAAVVAKSDLRTGLCTVFIQHTSAGLLIQENVDPSVRRDLAHWLDELAPESRAWEHNEEGADDMPAHAKAAVTRTSETIPITEGKLALGQWQALYLLEFRAAPHRRQLIVHLSGQ